MSYQRVLKALVNLGLNNTEAMIYVFLAQHGTKEEKILAIELEMQCQQLHRSLGNLKEKKLVNTKPGHPTVFSPIAFNKALDILVKAHLKETIVIEEEKTEILDQWNNMINKKTTTNKRKKNTAAA